MATLEGWDGKTPSSRRCFAGVTHWIGVSGVTHGFYVYLHHSQLQSPSPGRTRGFTLVKSRATGELGGEQATRAKIRQKRWRFPKRRSV